jgi:hypothetical protein
LNTLVAKLEHEVRVMRDQFGDEIEQRCKHSVFYLSKVDIVALKLVDCVALGRPPLPPYVLFDNRVRNARRGESPTQEDSAEIEDPDRRHASQQPRDPDGPMEP